MILPSPSVTSDGYQRPSAIFPTRIHSSRIGSNNHDDFRPRNGSYCCAPPATSTFPGIERRQRLVRPWFELDCDGEDANMIFEVVKLRLLIPTITGHRSS